MRLAAALLIAGSAGLALGGCRGSDESSGHGEQPEVLLFCGAGLRSPMEVLAREFSTAEGVSVVVDYAGGEVLLSKIKLSGQGDLYMPGDNRFVDTAAAQGLIVSRWRVCCFVPTILVRKGNPNHICGLADLARADVRLGLGDPRVCPVGIVSHELFLKNEIPRESVERSLKFQSATVNELGMQVQTGALDAVIVWDAVAKQYSQHADEVPIPLEQNVVSTVEIAVLSSASRTELAKRFAEFVCSPRGQEVFGQHGYRVDAPRASQEAGQ